MDRQNIRRLVESKDKKNLLVASIIASGFGELDFVLECLGDLVLGEVEREYFLKKFELENHYLGIKKGEVVIIVRIYGIVLELKASLYYSNSEGDLDIVVLDGLGLAFRKTPFQYKYDYWKGIDDDDFMGKVERWIRANCREFYDIVKNRSYG